MKLPNILVQTHRSLPENDVYKIKYTVKDHEANKLAAKHIYGNSSDTSLNQGFNNLRNYLNLDKTTSTLAD